MERQDKMQRPYAPPPLRPPLSPTTERSGPQSDNIHSERSDIFFLDMWKVKSQDFLGRSVKTRQAVAFVHGDDVIYKLFTELAYRYKPFLLPFYGMFIDSELADIGIAMGFVGTEVDMLHC
ncbi:hypothetical protein Syun_026119 [Stephania yunnanensis]|uniref:Uncharacterized protein n=1 Tax=Stephania yunnanensis TaxID=152371 RepID=A0AAP0HW04_9MAGN